MIPPRLKAGGTIGIASPCAPADEKRYAPWFYSMRALGFNVKTAPNFYKMTYGYGASEIERAEDINALFQDDEVDMILFGGGEIGAEPIPYIDYEMIKKHPKPVCSFSNGTSILNAINALTGLEVYYGFAPGEFGDILHYDWTQFERNIMNRADDFQKLTPWRALTGGIAEGTLVGGYLGLLPAIFTNKYTKPTADGNLILLAEDFDKYVRVEAVAQNLAFIEMTDYMPRIKGLIFGCFSNDEMPNELYELLRRFGERNNIPVVKCDDFGHGRYHGIIPLGRKARLDAENLVLTYL